MVKVAQILSGLLALVLCAFAAFYLFNPAGAAAARGFEPSGDYGMTNVRILAAPFLMMGIMSGIGAIRKNPIFLAPAAIYFLVAILIRVVGVFVDGADATTIRVLIPAAVLFAVAEFGLQVFKRAESNTPQARPA